MRGREAPATTEEPDTGALLGRTGEQGNIADTYASGVRDYVAWVGRKGQPVQVRHLNEQERNPSECLMPYGAGECEMAKKVEGFVFKRTGSVGGGVKHPWDDYLDGSQWQIEQSDVGEAKLITLAMMARTHAKKRGLRVRYSLDKANGVLTLEAYKPSEAQLRVEAERAERRAAEKAEEDSSEPQGSEEDTTSEGEQGTGRESENGEAVEQHTEPTVERTESTKARKKRERAEKAAATTA